MTGQERWKLSSQAYVTVWILFKLWGDKSILVLVEEFSVSASPSSDIPTTFFLVKHCSWPEMWTVALLPTHLLVPYIFLSLFKHFLNVALSLWLKMHSKHSAMQKHDEGLSIWKTNSFTWWLLCFGVALLSSQLLRNKLKNWWLVAG